PEIDPQIVADLRRSKIRQRWASLDRRRRIVGRLKLPAALADLAHWKPDARPSHARGNDSRGDREPFRFDLPGQFVGDESGGDVTVAPHADAQRPAARRRQ